MATTTWELDPTHSEIQFKIKHLMISTVTGQFGSFKATVKTEDDDFATARTEFEAGIHSISTNNEQRDQHLQNGDFFDVEKYPKILFTGDRMEKTGTDTFKLHGILTMRGKALPVVLDVEWGGTGSDPWGNTRAGFAVSGKINRSDFGLSFGLVSETGNIMLGDEVKLLANVQFVKQAELQPA